MGDQEWRNNVHEKWEGWAREILALWERDENDGAQPPSKNFTCNQMRVVPPRFFKLQPHLNFLHILAFLFFLAFSLTFSLFFDFLTFSYLICKFIENQWKKNILYRHGATAISTFANVNYATMQCNAHGGYSR